MAAAKIKKFISLVFLIYLREFAKLQIRKNKPLIIGVTGSAGKSSLRNAIASILREKYKIKVSYKANSESGIPLNILGIKPKNFSVFDWLRMAVLAPIKLLTNWEKYEIYIAEMGIDSPYPPKNMEYLLTIIQPQIGVFLNALPVHSQFFDNLVTKIDNPETRREKIVNLIAREKGKLIEFLDPSGIAIINIDDPKVKEFKNKTKARVFTFSSEKDANLKAKNVNITKQGFSMEVVEEKQKYNLRFRFILDEYYSQTLLAAIAVARTLDISMKNCIKTLEKYFSLPPGRMTIIPGIKNSTILDSSYNASPKTMISAIETLNKIAEGRKVAILGDMRELGKISQIEHERVAEVIFKTCDLVITVGPMMRKWCVTKLLKLGFSNKRVNAFINPYDAAFKVEKLIKDNDSILVKGSQNTIFLEIIVEKLMKSPENANKLLCRRGTFWDEKREKLRIN